MDPECPSSVLSGHAVGEEGKDETQPQSAGAAGVDSGISTPDQTFGSEAESKGKRQAKAKGNSTQFSSDVPTDDMRVRDFFVVASPCPSNYSR